MTYAKNKLTKIMVVKINLTLVLSVILALIFSSESESTSISKSKFTMAELLDDLLVLKTTLVNEPAENNVPDSENNMHAAENSTPDNDEKTAGIQFQKHKVIRRNNHILISYNYMDGKCFYLNYSKCGPNSILSIDSIYFLPDNDDSINSIINNTSKPFMRSETDWIGPYNVKSDLVNDTNMLMLTGGWHNYKFNGTNITTARTIYYDVFADDTVVYEGDAQQCDIVKIVVVNLIKGYNTLMLSEPENEILKESVTYTIYTGRVDINLQIEALTDITINKYYGLQTQNLSWSGSISYENGAISNQSTGIDSSSGKKSEYPSVNSYIIRDNNNICNLKAWIDRDFGLGKMDYVQNDVPCAFTKHYGKRGSRDNTKSYFNLINGIPCKLTQGQTAEWRGGYIFEIGA